MDKARKGTASMGRRKQDALEQVTEQSDDTTQRSTEREMQISFSVLLRSFTISIWRSLGYLERTGRIGNNVNKKLTVTLTSLLHSKTYHLESTVLFKQCFMVIACCLLRNLPWRSVLT